MDKAATTDEVWTRLTEQPGVSFKWGGGPFKVIPSAYGVIVSGSHLESRLPDLQPVHAALVTRAAKAVQTRTRFFESHSPGVMALLRKEVAGDLPDPDFGVPNSPTAGSVTRRYWRIVGAPMEMEVLIYYSGSPNLRSISFGSQQELEDQFLSISTTEHHIASDAADQLWKFFRLMQPGDLFCALGKTTILGWGRIVGDYKYRNGLHSRKVDRLSGEQINTSDFPPTLVDKLTQDAPIVELTPEEFSLITGYPRAEAASLPRVKPDVHEIDTIPNTNELKVDQFKLLMQELKDLGLHFPTEMVSNYLLALQTKRFVIITGISGTGKTQLAIAVARHFQQDGRSPGPTSLSVGTHIETVEPYMRDHKRYMLPAAVTERLHLPSLGDQLNERQARIVFPQGEQYLTLSRSPNHAATTLLFKGEFCDWFLETFSVGDSFAIEPIGPDDGSFHGFRFSVPTDVQHSELPENHIVSAVRPDWSDNRGLLGYFNPLIGSYTATPFLRLLFEAQAEVKRADQEGREPAPFFVILDEMNLARVEHYFSDFLSALESGGPIHLHDSDVIEEGDPEDSVPVPRSLRVPDNVFFTGTVNVDETTYMFSPKVLDRAFTIELNRVDLETFGSEQPEDAGAFTLTRFAGSLGTARKPNRADWVAFGELMDGALRQVVLDIHALLSEEDRHFGYRVANEIARFVLLAREQTDVSDEALWTALDLAVLQKILPKFHGTQQELEDVLARLSEFVAPLPLPRTAAKIGSMQRRLKRQGFTSFIE